MNYQPSLQEYLLPSCLTLVSEEECTASKFLSMKQHLSRETVKEMTTQLEADGSPQIQRIIKTKQKEFFNTQKVF